MGDETISPFELFTYRRKSDQIIERNPFADSLYFSHPVEFIEIICEHDSPFNENHPLRFHSNLGFSIKSNCPYFDDANLIKYDFVNQKIYKGYHENVQDNIRPNEDIEWTEIDIEFPWEDLEKIKGSIYKIEWYPIGWVKYYELEPNEYIESIEIINTDDEFGLHKDDVALYQGFTSSASLYQKIHEYKIEPSSLNLNESGFVTEEDMLEFNSNNSSYMLQVNNLDDSKVILTLVNK